VARTAHRLLPASASADVPRIVTGRAVRGFADGFVSVLLARYLSAIGFSPLQIGAVVTGTLIGSAALTLAVGLTAHRVPVRSLLLAATGLMAATGVGFAAVTWFWPLLIVAVVGTLNPSAGDVSVFLPTEQAFVAGHVDDVDRPRLYAIYNLAGAFAGAFGALASAAPEELSRAWHWQLRSAQRAGFVLYAAAAVVIFVIYRGLRAETPVEEEGEEGEGEAKRGERPSLGESRRTVLELAALFSLDAAGGGFVVQSLLVLWLHLRFDLSAGTTGLVFFGVSLLGAASQLLAGRLAARFGLIRTMVFTHLPANALLALAAFAPKGWIAILLLLARALFSSMDVPARQAFVMAIVPPRERAAAASITNVPRSLASATTPLLAGLLLSHSDFGWPLLIAGTTKIAYDLLLLALYRDVPVEAGARRVRSRPSGRAT
jgi:MFS family permease